jgi:Lar family restriction alleviation protein
MSEAEEALRPCPFCGSRALVVDDVGTERRHTWVRCRACDATGPYVGAPEPVEDAEAIRQWNTRGQGGEG